MVVLLLHVLGVLIADFQPPAVEVKKPKIECYYPIIKQFLFLVLGGYCRTLGRFRIFNVMEAVAWQVLWALPNVLLAVNRGLYGYKVFLSWQHPSLAKL